MELKPAARTESEYETLASIWNAHFPDFSTTASEYRDLDERRSERFPHARLIAWEANSIVGYLSSSQEHWCYDPKRWDITIVVSREHQRRGFGTQCLNYIISEARKAGIEKLLASSIESHIEAQSFLKKHAFQLVQRNPISELKLANYDLEAHRPKLERVLDQGIRFVSAAELIAERPESLRQLYELSCEVEADTPQPGAYEPPSFDEWRKCWWEAATTLQDAWILAMDGDRMAGYTAYSRRGDGKRLYVEMTGTARGYRRRGIASALKYKAIEYAMARGAEVVVTDNEENNPMFSINLAFGFEPKPAWASYEMTIAE